MNLSEKCSIIDLQLQQTQKETDEVIKVLTEYLNQQKEHF